MSTARAELFAAWPWAYVACVSLLALTGTMQMPIASRYRIVAVPGLGWLGDFWLTHKLHYVGAIGLLALAGYVGTLWLLEWRRSHGLSALGWARVALLALLIGTGAVRVLKNLPGVNFAPDPIMLVDWAHLGLAVALAFGAGAAGLQGLVLGRAGCGGPKAPQRRAGFLSCFATAPVVAARGCNGWAAPGIPKPPGCLRRALRRIHCGQGRPGPWPLAGWYISEVASPRSAMSVGGCVLKCVTTTSLPGASSQEYNLGPEEGTSL